MKENQLKVQAYLTKYEIQNFDLKINQYLIIEDGQKQYVDNVQRFLLFSLSTERVKLKLELSSLYDIFSDKLGKVTI